MLKKRSQQRLVIARVSNRVGHGTAQLQYVVGNEVGQVVALGVLPNLFGRVKFRGVRRQPLNFNPVTIVGLKSLRCGAMYRPTIHNQDNRSTQATKHCPNERFEVIGLDIVVGDVEVESQMFALRRDADRRDNRQAIVSIPTKVNGCLAFWRPRSTHGRLQHKAGFIEKYDAFAVSSRFFLSAANPSCANARWFARRVRGHDVRVFDNSIAWR